MISFPRTKLVKISTPYAKSGVLFEDFRRGFGQDDPDLLVWRASSLLMNPALRAERLDRERRLDPDRYAREYEAEFAEDVDGFLAPIWVDAAIVPGRFELPPRDGVRYVAAVDPSGGGEDSFTLAVAHGEGSGGERRVVQDVMKGWDKRRTGHVDLRDIVRQISEIVKRYSIKSVIGDRYAAQWVRQAFQDHGVRYEDAPDKATAYVNVEPLFAQGRIHLLDSPTLVRELKNLEHRPRAGARPSIDHPRGGHDDHANAIALAAAKALVDRPILQIFAV
jgi:hypothetical protein